MEIDMEKPEVKTDTPKLDRFLRYSKIMLIGNYNVENWHQFVKLYIEALDEYTDEMHENIMSKAKAVVVHGILAYVAVGFIGGMIVMFLLMKIP